MLPKPRRCRDDFKSYSVVKGYFNLGFFSVSSSPPLEGSDAMIQIDEFLSYRPYSSDFGPLDIGCVTRFIRAVHSSHELLNRIIKTSPITLVCADTPANRANSAFILGSYLLVCTLYRRTFPDAFNVLPAEKLEGFKFFDSLKSFLVSKTNDFDFTILVSKICSFFDKIPNIPSYVEAGECYKIFPERRFSLTLSDTLSGLGRAVSLGWYDFLRFDVEKYESIDQKYHANWVIPNEIMASVTPYDPSVVLKSGNARNAAYVMLPEAQGGPPSIADTISMFKSYNIKTIVRLNDHQYHSASFTNEGFNHAEILFADGSNPADDLVERFLELTLNKRNMPMMVHCKAGLGRTGCMIGSYAIWRYSFTAKQFIGWSRICRPGMVMDRQQHWLCSKEPTLNKMMSRSSSSVINRRNSNISDISTSDEIEDDDTLRRLAFIASLSSKNNYLIKNKYPTKINDSSDGDPGQGDRLIEQMAAREKSRSIQAKSSNKQ